MDFQRGRVTLEPGEILEALDKATDFTDPGILDWLTECALTCNKQDDPNQKICFSRECDEAAVEQIQHLLEAAMPEDRNSRFVSRTCTDDTMVFRPVLTLIIGDKQSPG